MSLILKVVNLFFDRVYEDDFWLFFAPQRHGLLFRMSPEYPQNLFSKSLLSVVKIAMSFSFVIVSRSHMIFAHIFDFLLHVLLQK